MQRVYDANKITKNSLAGITVGYHMTDTHLSHFSLSFFCPSLILVLHGSSLSHCRLET